MPVLRARLGGPVPERGPIGWRREPDCVVRAARTRLQGRIQVAPGTVAGGDRPRTPVELPFEVDKLPGVFQVSRSGARLLSPVARWSGLPADRTGYSGLEAARGMERSTR